MKLSISQSAIRLVTNPLPAPTVCPHCGGPVSLVNNKVICGGVSYGTWPYAYACDDLKVCNSYVGLHPDTDIPLGSLATAEMRAARNLAKNDFNLMWNSNKMGRSAAYADEDTPGRVPLRLVHGRTVPSREVAHKKSLKTSR